MTRTTTNNKNAVAVDPRASLEARIVSALADNTAEARYLSDLIVETERSITEADVVATHLQQSALDPVESPDAAKAKEAAEFASFVVRRLISVLPRLEKAHQQVVAIERSARWNAAADQVQTRRDALAAEFSETYSSLISQLIDLFHRIREMDQQIDNMNGAAPNSESRRVLPVGQQSIMTHTKLLDPSGQQIWPPPQPQILPEQVMPTPPHAGSDWWRVNQERDAERYRESRRVADYYANQAKAREEREAAEARAAHLRNGGTP